MIVKSIEVPTSPKNLLVLLDNQRVRANVAIGIQAPETNTGTVYVGGSFEQPGELRPKSNTLLPTTNLNEIFVKGTSGDRLTIFLF